MAAGWVAIIRTAGAGWNPIRRDELERLISSRQGWRIEDEPTLPGAQRLVSGEGGRAFVFQRGQLGIKNPDHDTLQLMLELASELGARVRRDAGFRTYRTPDETYSHPDDKAIRDKAQREVERMLRRARVTQIAWIAGFFVIAVALALLVELCAGG